MKLGVLKEFIHFGLTSQDINNTAIPFFLKDFITEEYFPESEDLIRINAVSKEWKDVAMLDAYAWAACISDTRRKRDCRIFATRREAS